VKLPLLLTVSYPQAEGRVAEWVQR